MQWGWQERKLLGTVRASIGSPPTQQPPPRVCRYPTSAKDANRRVMLSARHLLAAGWQQVVQVKHVGCTSKACDYQQLVHVKHFVQVKHVRGLKHVRFSEVVLEVEHVRELKHVRFSEVVLEVEP